MAKDVKILDRKIVGQKSPQGWGEWRLVEEEPGVSLWKPYVVDGSGEVIDRPAWMPLPGSQHLFLECPVFECLFHGNRGPGKTAALLMDFAKEVGKGYGKAWRGILFRRQYGDLDDVVKKIEEIFPKIFPGFRFKLSKSEYMAVWPTGEALLLRHMKDEDDYGDYHGHEYPWIGWEELTQWENDKAYRKMMSCCRSAKPGIPVRVRATTNPYGVGHNWVKKRFKLPDSNGRVISEAGQLPRVAIKSSLDENFLMLHNNPNYKAQIAEAASSEAEKRAWLDGDWDVTSGGMIDDLWDKDIHIVDNFPANVIPFGWSVTRAYDHGQSHPFAVGWFLESNGEPIELPNGQLIGRIRGDIIMWSEWYGSTGEDNVGLRMSARNIAQGIIDREEDDDIHQRVQPGPSDTEIWSKDNRGTARSPADDMEDVGVYWERADKSPGSRKRGWELLRNYLKDAIPEKDGTRERPGFFVTRRCRNFLNLVPPMPRCEDDPDDVPKKYEDHMADMVRYRIAWEIPGMWRRGF